MISVQQNANRETPEACKTEDGKRYRSIVESKTWCQGETKHVATVQLGTGESESSKATREAQSSDYKRTVQDE